MNRTETRRQQQARQEKAMQKYSQDRQNILEACKKEALSTAEISRALGYSTNNHRIFDLIQQLVEEGVLKETMKSTEFVQAYRKAYQTVNP